MRVPKLKSLEKRKRIQGKQGSKRRDVNVITSRRSYLVRMDEKGDLCRGKRRCRKRRLGEREKVGGISLEWIVRLEKSRGYRVVISDELIIYP